MDNLTPPRSGEYTVIKADALALPLDDESVDLVVTSPPYFALRSYTDGGKHYDGQVGDEATPAEFVDNLIKATEEMVRVLKPTGSIWVNLGDKYAGGGNGGHKGGTIAASQYDRHVGQTKKVAGVRTKSLIGLPWRYALRCIDDLGLTLRAEVIWAKANGLPESVTDRVRRQHETWFHFTKQPKYYADLDPLREPHKYPDDNRAERTVTYDKDMTAHIKSPLNPKGKIPGSYWLLPTEPLRIPEDLQTQHFAAFPSEFPRRIISGWCPPDGVVLDPFGGTGTTAHVAAALGRAGISVDLSSDYCKVAEDVRVYEKRAKKVRAATAQPNSLETK